VNSGRRAAVVLAIALGLFVSFSLPAGLHAKDIRIAVPGKSLVFLPLYVGVAKGHFQSGGFTPQVILMQSSLAMNALVSGEIDYATSFGSGIRAAVSGLPVRGIAVYLKSSPFFLMARPSIGTIRDLKGKKIGITSFGSATHATARAALRLQQMDSEKDVTIMAMGTEPTYFAALMNGTIDAAVLTPPNDARARLAGYRELAYSGDVLPEPSSGITVSLRKLREDPGEVREVLSASLKSIQFIIREKRATVDLIAKDWRVDPPVAVASYESILRALAENGIADQAAIERMIQDAKLLTKSTRAVDTVKAIRELTEGGVDYAIDAVGLPQTQEQILRAVRSGFPGLYRGGTALLIGLTPPGTQVCLDTSLFAGGRYFTRTSGGDCRPDRDFPLFIRWYREGKLKLNDLVTNRYTLDQINTAVEDLESGRIIGRGIITYL